jgi:hypothetical protein
MAKFTKEQIEYIKKMLDERQELTPQWLKVLLPAEKHGGTMCLDRKPPILRVNSAVRKSHDVCSERYTVTGVL